MGEPIISFKNVQKAFEDNVIYTGLSLDVFQGETLTVIGGSGVGKSVMLKLLIGLLKPDSGSIVAFGDDVTQMKDRDLQKLRQKVGMLFQGGALFDSMTVEENISYSLVEHKWGSVSEMKDRVATVLEMVGLSGIEKMRPPELSGGMKKRVGLARAIAIEPEVILYDEPTTGLDPKNIRRINGLIRYLQEQMKVTSIVVTHDMDSCFTVSDRIAFLNGHEICWTGTCEEAKASSMPDLAEFVLGGRGVL
jgi:phospholipid/cholesterol/gamma-HCH transport system ATP-binding protein